MAKISQNKQSESRPLLSDDLAKAIEKLEQQIKDLEDFDVNTIAGRLDVNTKALEDNINDTLSDVFGYDTAEYRNYAILSLDTLPIELGGPKPQLPVLQQAYQKGINVCATRLKSLKEVLQQKLMDTKANLQPPIKPAEPTL